MQVAVVNRQDLGNGRHAVTVRVRRGYGNNSQADFGDEIMLVVPSTHRLLDKEHYWVEIGRYPNGNPILEDRVRDKGEVELTEHDLLELLGSLTERLHVVEELVK